MMDGLVSPSHPVFKLTSIGLPPFTQDNEMMEIILRTIIFIFNLVTSEGAPYVMMR